MAKVAVYINANYSPKPGVTAQESFEQQRQICRAYVSARGDEIVHELIDWPEQSVRLLRYREAVLLARNREVKFIVIASSEVIWKCLKLCFVQDQKLLESRNCSFLIARNPHRTALR